ncbi:MAG: nucleotide exchange factor GrpE [Oscillospiraceae bacterium]|nr:nucleotide exchange factor GrpE [Oscillospiraceae bacterium]
MPKKPIPEEREAELPPETPGTEAAPQTEEPAPPEASPAETELAALKDQHLRLMAEYDNYRKRSQKEREALYGDVRAETVKALLPVMDNLERAVAAPCTDAAYRQGVEMTLKQCAELLASIGVARIEAEGQAFDPNLHEAVSHLEDEGVAENTVVQVFQPGYRMGDRVLRHAMVAVAN